MATVEPKDNLEEVGRRVAESWEPAQAHWSHFLLLREPTDDPKQPAIAQINLATRQVSLHFGQVVRKSLFDCVEALLAHEIGHHVRFPGSLAVEARLRLLEKSLIPLDDYSTLNLFTDLLINEQLGPLYHEQFVRVYQAFDPFDDWESDPAFLFYLAVYEELWRLKPGTLLGPARSRFETTYGGYRADAQLLTQNLFGLGPNLYTQFLYFASVICRYLQPLRGKKLVCRDPNQCGRGDPSTDDWADALVPSAREEEAIRRALHEGWITEKQGERMTGANGLETRILGLPGQGTDNAEKVPEVMAAYYRQQAQRYLLRPPPQRTLGEAVVPTTLDDWEPGDAVRDIDWLGTLVQRGPVLGAAQPLRRARIAELEGHDVPLWQPRVEIYLDVSHPGGRLGAHAAVFGGTGCLLAVVPVRDRAVALPDALYRGRDGIPLRRAAGVRGEMRARPAHSRHHHGPGLRPELRCRDGPCPVVCGGGPPLAAFCFAAAPPAAGGRRALSVHRRPRG
jgi:hypothetical protein